MEILIYKRTHIGDPNESGRFGNHNCMGRVRSWAFDAVIGVGGIGQEVVRNKIASKVNWVGIGPTSVGIASDGYPVIKFERFCLLDENGPLLKELAPKLARRMFAKHGPRFLKIEVDDEIEAILKLARKAPSTPKGSAKIPKTKPCRKSRPTGGCSKPQRKGC